MAKLEALRQVQLKKACIRRENRKQERSEQTNQYVDGDTTEWSRFGCLEATRKTQDSNRGGNSLHPTQQWMERSDDE